MRLLPPQFSSEAPDPRVEDFVTVSDIEILDNPPGENAIVFRLLEISKSTTKVLIHVFEYMYITTCKSTKVGVTRVTVNRVNSPAAASSQKP
jgi:hypothetical protein